MVERVSPQEFREYLQAAKDLGVMQVTLKLDDVEMAVAFAPEMSAPLPGEKPEPGGWKASNLDDVEKLFGDQ